MNYAKIYSFLILPAVSPFPIVKSGSQVPIVAHCVVNYAKIKRRLLGTWYRHGYTTIRVVGFEVYDF